jgi:ParB family transcriptional regulator, chromosome partitioning protein
LAKATIERLRDLGSGRRDAIMMDPKIIQIEEDHNPRNYQLKENREHLDELKASIKVRGVLQPLLVRYDSQQQCAVLVDGECRLRAVLELIQSGLEIESVPVLQVQAGNETERLVLALTANTGKPLSKWESGTAFKRLANFGWSNAKIAEQIGYSERFIKEAIELTDAPEEVKHLLSEGAVTPSLVRYHMRKAGGNVTLSIRGEVEKAKAQGKKVAKRTMKKPESKVLTAVRLLLKEFNADKLEDKEFPFIEVDRKKLLRLWQAVNG